MGDKESGREGGVLDLAGSGWPFRGRFDEERGGPKFAVPKDDLGVVGIVAVLEVKRFNESPNHRPFSAALNFFLVWARSGSAWR